MTSASELFCNRRSRFGRTVDAALDFDSSPPARTSNHYNNRRNRHASTNRRLDACDHIRRPRRHPPRPWENETIWLDQSSLSSHSNTTTGGNSNTQDRLTLSSNDSRLPGDVLLARERLFERLRGISLSGSSNRALSNLNLNDHETEDNLRISHSGDSMIALARDWGAHTNHFPEQPRSKRTPGLNTGDLSCLLVEEFNFSDNFDENTQNSFRECSICLESFKDRDKLAKVPCGHKFHYSCLVPWLRICGCCPYCRKDLVL